MRRCFWLTVTCGFSCIKKNVNHDGLWFVLCVIQSGTNGGYREEPVDHRLTDREWADEWRHLDHVSLRTGTTGAVDFWYRKNVICFTGVYH